MALVAEVSLSCADYGFEYSDEDVQEEDVDIENQYYNSKGELKNIAMVDGPRRTASSHLMPFACHKDMFDALHEHAGLLEGEPQEALKGFKEVISMEGERGEWWVLRKKYMHFLHCVLFR